MMHPGVVLTIALVSLGANGILGAVAANHLRQIEKLQDSTEGQSEELNTLGSKVTDQSQDIRALKARPEVNLRELATTLVSMQGQVDGLSDSLSGIRFRLDDVEFQIERPFFCRADDPVYWASVFDGGGFTC